MVQLRAVLEHIGPRARAVKLDSAVPAIAARFVRVHSRHVCQQLVSLPWSSERTQPLLTYSYVTLALDPRGLLWP